MVRLRHLTSFYFLKSCSTGTVFRQSSTKTIFLYLFRVSCFTFGCSPTESIFRRLFFLHVISSLAMSLCFLFAIIMPRFELHQLVQLFVREANYFHSMFSWVSRLVLKCQDFFEASEVDDCHSCVFLLFNMLCDCFMTSLVFLKLFVSQAFIHWS